LSAGSNVEKLRAWWSHRQGLDGRLAGVGADRVLAETGWARSVGGVGPYLTLFSRAGISREAADAAVARVEICELPSVRGCTYVLPAADFALGLRAGASLGDQEMKLARTLGVTDKEIDKLCGAVMKALGKSALEPDEIRVATGGASRSLGEIGKKKGLTTTLPLALGRLQAEGEIRRIAANGRLDQQRYKYVVWRVGELKLTAEEVWTELARRYFKWTGPATLGEFQWFSALSGKAAKSAVEGLKLTAVEDRWILAEDRDAFEAFKVPKAADYRLVSSIDGICLLRRNIGRILDAEDFSRIGAVKDLPSHAIVDRGRVVGLWEFDPENGTIAWAAFGARNKEMEKAVARMEIFVRDQLGDARGFSLDSPKSRAPRIKALRDA
jgi:Winged helix DNA-binding domain